MATANNDNFKDELAKLKAKLKKFETDVAVAKELFDLQDWGKGEGALAGVPLYLKNEYLVLASKYPLVLHALYARMNRKYILKNSVDKIRNVWFSSKRNHWVYIFQTPEGKITHRVDNGTQDRFRLFLRSSDFSVATNKFEAEKIALEKLKTLITEANFQEYFVTGSFFESSERSKIIYCFRRSRPTIAFRPTNDPEKPKILATLCCHPVGYYFQSFTGVLAPTDEVVAHLLMMRTDERIFWKKSQQHTPDSPLSAI